MVVARPRAARQDGAVLTDKLTQRLQLGVPAGYAAAGWTFTLAHGILLGLGSGTATHTLLRRMTQPQPLPGVIRKTEWSRLWGFRHVRTSGLVDGQQVRRAAGRLDLAGLDPDEALLAGVRVGLNDFGMHGGTTAWRWCHRRVRERPDHRDPQQRSRVAGVAGIGLMDDTGVQLRDGDADVTALLGDLVARDVCGEGDLSACKASGVWLASAVRGRGRVRKGASGDCERSETNGQSTKAAAVRRRREPPSHVQ